MQFNSFTFIFFFLVVFSLYLLLRGHYRRQNLLLLAAGYVFYGYWDYRFLLLLFASTAVDYAVGRFLGAVAAPGRRRWLLAGSIVFNLGILAFFKYFNFFADAFARLLSTAGVTADMPVLQVILPVGVSFYTFQSMAYTIDVFRGRVPSCRSFIDFALYVAFFPQLVMGPIERPGTLLPQIQRPRCLDRTIVAQGLRMLLLGYALKVVMADTLSRYADLVFPDPESMGGPACLLGILAFAWQIFADFAGYSLIALGLARMMGFTIAVNFRRPYLASSPRDFWSRWHISLSSWFRDYLYIPLGGNRHGRARTAINLFLTMALCGLWHGAALTYVLWGAYHGLLLVAHRFVRGDAGVAPDARRGVGMRRLPAILGTFALVCFGWLIFRAPSLAFIGRMLAVIAGDWRWTPFCSDAVVSMAALCLPLMAWHVLEERREKDAEPLGALPWGVRVVICSALFFAVAAIGFGKATFIYFQF
jgi:alginate O-acetyltransferase complex protein AlgI